MFTVEIPSKSVIKEKINKTYKHSKTDTSHRL